MRLLAGADIGAREAAPRCGRRLGRSEARARWLAETLAACRRPETLAAALPGEALKATLRPYQEVGAALARLPDAARPRRLPCRRHGARQDAAGAGAAADARRPRRRQAAPSLIVAPASLLANWAAEAERFAPSLKVFVAHPAFAPAERLKAPTAEQLG